MPVCHKALQPIDIIKSPIQLNQCRRFQNHKLCPLKVYVVPARPARRGKVLDEVSAAIPGDASRRERGNHWHDDRSVQCIGLVGQCYGCDLVLCADPLSFPGCVSVFKGPTFFRVGVKSALDSCPYKSRLDPIYFLHIYHKLKGLTWSDPQAHHGSLEAKILDSQGKYILQFIHYFFASYFVKFLNIFPVQQEIFFNVIPLFVS